MITETRIGPEVLRHAAAVLRCLGHPLRLRLLEALETGEKTVSELQEYAGVSQPMVSQHLMVLKAHGVVDLRRAGPFARYSIVEPKVKAILECIRAGQCGAEPEFRDA
ncbi:MAG TPA: metalloregulator ArsR/SmtB family transcription factor [Gemmatimonadales bacterium]|nr:metalloregulator ArsR/SmtB family transcription factor [Gemmatimonadales bacterium]